MLRRILISLGLLIAFLPYLGFPHSWQAIISTIVGFLIVLLLVFSRKGKIRRGWFDHLGNPEEEAKALHVEHVEIVDGPEVHIVRETIVEEVPETPVAVEPTLGHEKRANHSRGRRKSDSFAESPSESQ